MKNLKKIILGLSTIGIIASPIATTISCGNKKGIKVTNIKEKTFAPIAERKSWNLTQITDGGSIDDLSFNQSAHEAINAAAKNLPDIKNNYVQTQTPDQIKSGITNATQNGSKVFVFPGFTFKGLLEQAEIADSLSSKGAYAITIDGGTPTKESMSSRTINWMFRVEQSAFIAGYSASEFLNTQNIAKPKIGTFAGSNGAGVTEFVLGFLAGAAYWNTSNKATDKDVTFATNNLVMNTGWSAGNGKTVSDTLVANGANVILPVVGPQTGDALGAVANKKDAYVIGVDVDQAVAYPNQKNKFLTSITKNLGQTIYDSIESIYTNTVLPTSTKDKIGFTQNYGTLADGYTKVSKSYVTGGQAILDKHNKSANDEVFKIASNFEIQPSAFDSTAKLETLVKNNAAFSINDGNKNVDIDLSTLGITKVQA